MLAWAAPGDTYTVTGSVVNAVTGQPVRQAAVNLQCQSIPTTGRAKALADAGGRFEFPGIAPGECAVSAERHGFAHQTVTYTVSAAGAELVLRLTPYGVITGKVQDEYNDPLIGANVQVLQSSVIQGQRAVRPLNSGSTNDLGEYRIAQLPPGRYYVTAAVPNAMNAEIIYARSYYASSAEFVSATPLDLAPGGDARADFRLLPVHGYTIHGRVAGTSRFTGIITLAAQSAVDSFNGAAHPVHVNPEIAEFTVKGVTPGHYQLKATSFEAGGSLTGEQEVAVGDADLDGIVLSLSRGTQIDGVIRVEEKDGAASFDPQRVGVSLRPREFGLNPQPSARLRPDKTFTLASVSPADYLLQVNVPEPHYVKSATFGGIDALANPISVAPGSVPPPLEIVIGSNGGEVSGTVTKGDEPAANCGVLLARNGGVTQEKTVSADASGHFRVTALAPGDYTAYAWPDIGVIEYRNPEVIQRYRGEHVTVSEGGKQTVDLKLNVEP